MTDDDRAPTSEEKERIRLASVAVAADDDAKNNDFLSTLQRRVLTLDGFSWRIFNVVWLPIYQLILAVAKSPVWRWLREVAWVWCQSAGWHWTDYINWVATLWYWFHSRVALRVIKFYRFLLRVWLLWLMLWFTFGMLSAFAEDGKRQLHKQQFDVRWPLVYSAFDVARRGCEWLTVMLSLPVVVPLSVPFFVIKKHALLWGVLKYWASALVQLVTSLLGSWVFVLVEQIWPDIVLVSEWVVFVALTLYKGFLWIGCGLVYMVVGLGFIVGYVASLVAGCAVAGVSLLTRLCFAPVNLVLSILDLLPPPQLPAL